MQFIRFQRFAFHVYLAATALTAFGQGVTGSLSGRVTDTTAGAITGATIELTSVERGTVSTTLTNEVGIYVFPSVQPGTYHIAARSTGFKQGEAKNLPVAVGSRIEQNFLLEVGSVRESVTVETAEPLVNTVSSTVSSVVEGPPIQNLPLNGRNTLSLALTQPGVTPMTISSTGFAGNGFSIAGGRANSVTYTLDGGNNNSVANSTAVVNPNPDTVGEFRILTNNYAAEYGRSNGGVVIVSTKSGTNDLHGSVYDYFRNQALNANNFLNQSTPGAYIARPQLIRNQFGGTAGGPLTIPKILNGRDRFFWFAGFQGQRQTSTTVGSQVGTFTPDQLKGDFSKSANGRPDANVAAFLAQRPYYQPNPTLAAQAIIDPTRIDPVTRAIIASAPIPTSASGIITPNGASLDNRDEFLGKVDLQASQRHRYSVTLVRNHNVGLSPFPGGSAPGYATRTLSDQYFASMNLTSTLSPSLFNEAHFTVQRTKSGTASYVSPLPDPVSLGMKITPDLGTAPPVLSFGVTGLTLGASGSSVPGQFADTSYVWTDNFSWVKGSHTMKFGGSFSIIQNNGQFAYQTNGTLNFAGPTGIGSGNDLADFLFGLPNTFTQWPNAFSAARGHQYGAFAQDEWKVRRNLTLNLGIRYEYNTPKYDPQMRNYMILPGQQSTKFPLAPKGLNFPCDPAAPCKGVSFPDRNNWGPRFGFAWDPRGKGRTSIRGGIGVFFDILNAQDIQWQNGTVPFYSSANLIYTRANVPTSGPSTLMSDPYGSAGVPNPFPSKPLSPTTDFAKAGFLPIGPSSVFIDPYQRNPYTYSYNFTVQQALGGGMGLQVAYVGSSSHKQVVNVDTNSFILGTTTRPLNTQPGLQYTNPFAWATANKTIGSSNYHGLLTSVTKRSGATKLGEAFFTVSYTYSKTMSDQDAYLQNVSAYDKSLFYAPSAYDLTHRFVISGGWELPFGKLGPKPLKLMLGGWNIFPIFSTQSGFPVDFSAGLTRSQTVPGPGGDGVVGLVRPDWLGGTQQMMDPRNVQSFTINGARRTGRFFFDPSALFLPACFTSTAAPGTTGGCPQATYGNLQRNTLRGPGLTNMDLSVEKRTPLGEHVQLIFRAEYYNAFNHTQFLAPSGQVSVRSALVGQSTSTNPPRIGQLALKIVF